MHKKNQRKKAYGLTGLRAYGLKIALLGFDREGKSTLRFLKHSPQFKTAEIRILDQNKNIRLPRGVRAELGKHYLKNLSSFDLVFRTPGIPWNKPELIKARRAGVAFSSHTKLFFAEAERRGAKIIGVTGTKGKGTTSSLFYTMMKTGKKNVFLAGNIGVPMLDVLPRLRKSSYVVLELSSFQLQDLETSPHTAVVLDIFPDHQDAHLNLKEYYEAKTNIARHQKPGDRIFFFKNHPLSRWVAAKSRGRKISVDEKKFRLFTANDLKVPGYHNFKNAMMAAVVARAMGVPARKIVETAKHFRGNEHRLEFVRRISINRRQQRKSASIEFYNDSAATIPESTAAAIASFPGKDIILIAGGRSKVANYSPIRRALKNSRTKLVVLFGENKHTLKAQIKSGGAPIVLSDNLRLAVKTSYLIAHSSEFQTPLVLFSPASQSFDQFKNYADRGRQFKEMVKGLIKK